MRNIKRDLNILSVKIGENRRLIWVFLLILNIVVINSSIFAYFEDVGFLSALFYVGTNLLNEYARNPQTFWGRFAVISTMVVGILVFTYIILSHFSEYLITKLQRFNKVNIKDRFKLRDHIVICGMSPKIRGILRELRDPELNESLKLPIVIVSPQVRDLEISDEDLREYVFGIEGEPHNFDALNRANVEKCSRVLILAKQDNLKDHYDDAYVSMVYRAIKVYLESKSCYQKIEGDIHVVLEFKDPDINLLSCCSSDIAEHGVYHDEIKNTEHCMNVEPVYLEKIPTYLFIQSILNKDINEVVHRLLTPQFEDTNEFYYLEIEDGLSNWVGHSFYKIEKALIDDNATAIGFIRRNAFRDNDRGSLRSELRINPSKGDNMLKKGDILVLLAYTGKELEKAKKRLIEIDPGSIEDVGRLYTEGEKGHLDADPGHDEEIFIINWNHAQISDILLEWTKVKKEEEDIFGDFERTDITILSRNGLSKEDFIDKIDEKLSDGELNEYINLDFEYFDEPLTASQLKGFGITEDKKEELRIIILSDEDDSIKESDNRVLYQSQIIENKISEEIITSVEVKQSKNYRFLGPTNIDILVSVDDFSQRLLGQTILKPYLSLIFTNLLTFSKESNEFYIRDVPKKYIGERIVDFQQELIGYPVIFIGHIRPAGPGDVGGSFQSMITINPKVRGEYRAIDFNKMIRKLERGKDRIIDTEIFEKEGYERVKKSDRFEEGDQVILISREPDIVDNVLSVVSG